MMFLRAGLVPRTLLLCVAFAGIVAAREQVKEWDVAVAIENEVQLLNSNGTILGTAVQKFTRLKALTFDNIRHQFVVSDMDGENDTIYTIQLTKHSAVNAIVENLSDDVQGLALDPITDTLYWTDRINRTINYVSLKDPFHKSQVLLKFDDVNPQDIAIDVCRRFIYWTNSNISSPSIERATLDGRNREILIKDKLFMPQGIAVDQLTKRIFWAHKNHGIYFEIESANFDGTQRAIVHSGTHQNPFGVAVDKEAVYWTDVTNNMVWKKKIHIKEELPEQLHSFKEKPMGIVTKHLSIRNISECSVIFEIIENYTSSTEFYENTTDGEDVEKTIDKKSDCLNNGEKTDKGCLCKRGFVGSKCETSLCYNFCLHGNCHLSSKGFPTCKCPNGFFGTRCDKNLCEGFCLNNGNCIISKNSTTDVSCKCKVGYFGKRCEKNIDPIELCDTFCKDKETDLLVDQRNTFICRCEQGSYKILKNVEEVNAYEFMSSESISEPSFLSHFHDTAFIVLSVSILVMMILIIILSYIVCKNRRLPRVKKRIIVNKNITPLTFRPQQTSQQCEITIENCCNMNVCETPCFEPPQLRGYQVSRKDEKKTLLANMENGEDIY